jgi:hypothetical protein
VRRSNPIRKTALRALCGAFLTIGCALPAHAGDPPFSLAISTESSTLHAGAEVQIQVTLKNISGQDIWLRETSAQCDFSVNVLDSRDDAVADTEYGLAVKNRNQARPFIYHDQLILPPCMRLTHNNIVAIKPGASINADLTVSDLYDLPAPGQYRIEVQRKIPREPNQPILPQPLTDSVVKSNTITVTITE